MKLIKEFPAKKIEIFDQWDDYNINENGRKNFSILIKLLYFLFSDISKISVGIFQKS